MGSEPQQDPDTDTLEPSMGREFTDLGQAWDGTQHEPQHWAKISSWKKAGRPLKETRGHAGKEGWSRGEAELEITSSWF